MEDRTIIREKHGIANTRKVSMAKIENSDTQAVVVTDGGGEVILSMDSSSFPSALTPEQARLLADQLKASADRVEAAST